MLLTPEDRSAAGHAAAACQPWPPEPPGCTAVAEALLRSVAALGGPDDEWVQLDRWARALQARLPALQRVWCGCGPDGADAGPLRQLGGSAAPATQAPDEAPAAPAPTMPAAPAFPLPGQAELIAAARAGTRVSLPCVADALARAPWAAALQAEGVRAVLALPLPLGPVGAHGVLVLQADQAGWFDAAGLGLFDALADVVARVLSRAERRAAQARTASRDALTGLLNRQALPGLAQRLARHSPDDPSSAVVRLDLDHFKAVGDSHGSGAADGVLRTVAQALQGSLRRGDACLRWGGDAFLLVLVGANADEAGAVMHKLRRQLAALPHAVEVEGAPALQVTASMGVAAVQAGERLEAAIARADQALYAAKRSGRNRIVVG